MNNRKIFAIIAALMTSTFALKGQGLDEAKEMIENERYNSAELLLEKNISSGETDPQVNYLLVKAYLNQDKIKEADVFVTQHLKATVTTDADPLNRIAYARFLLNSGNKNAAETIFASVLNERKNQKNAALLLAMAEVVIEEDNGDTQAALQWLDMAAKREKQEAAIDMAKGLAYRKLGDASNAFLSYQEAIRKDPGNVKAHYLMGKIFVAQKNPEIYMQHFNKAYSIDSTYAPVLEELYNHYYFRDVRIAKKFLEKYIANTDHSLQHDYYLTDILFLNGEYQDAIKLANKIIQQEQVNAQPRLYKLIAYSLAKSGDSVSALTYLNQYFEKETPAKVIAADFQLIAQLTGGSSGQEDAAIRYYTIAADMDTIVSRKAEYAAAIAALYEKKQDHVNRAVWLGKLYEWKEKTNNVDLFNWGLAWYMGKEYQKTDSVFMIYTERYPEDIYGYYWRAQANASIDTSMADSLAVPYYRKVVELGELHKEKNKKMLLKAYGYLGGFEANVTKNYPLSLEWFEKYNAMEENAEVTKYIAMLRKWIADRN